VDQSPPLVLSLKTNGALPPLPSYSFMVWTGTAILFLVHLHTKFRNQTQFPQHCTLFALWNKRQSRNLGMLSVTHATIRAHDKKFENFYWLANKIK